MPKRKDSAPTQEEQSERFRREVERLIAAGELTPTEAAAAMERAMGGVRQKPES